MLEIKAGLSLSHIGLPFDAQKIFRRSRFLADQQVVQKPYHDQLPIYNKREILLFTALWGECVMKEKGNDRLYVRMLGGFSVFYGDREIILGRKSTLKFIQMLQLVWYHGEKGIHKEQLVKYLYDRADVSDSNNSVNNLMYQIRRQMAAAGLPKGEYILREDGIYRANPEFPVEVDVHQFEALLDAGGQAGTAEETRSCYEKALELYQGELLPMICTELWVLTEGLRLKNRFEECVQWLAEDAKKRSDYAAMGAYYEKAVYLYPYDGWQIGQIDVLVEKGEYKKAYEAYKEMADKYSEEIGLPPTQEMIDCYERLFEKVHGVSGEIGDIKEELKEFPGEEETGAYHCSYRGFMDICHMARRNMERTGYSLFLMLCTLIDYEGKVIQNEDKLKERSEVLREVLSDSLRKGDVYTKYNQSQYLLLLSGTNQENCGIVCQRINRRLKERLGTRAQVAYSLLSLAEV